MKILHTSDWHVGKKLGRYDRMAEYRDVLGEVVRVADAEDVDLVLVSGDLFDRAAPPMDALALVVETLTDLSGDGTRPVVAVSGNHDSGPLFEVLDPLLAPLGIRLVGDVKRPEEGGVLAVTTRNGDAAIGCFPFLREGRVVDFMEEMGSWYGTYADRVRQITTAYAARASELAGPDGVALLVAHFMVTGVRVGGHGRPRGERALHMGEAYSATSQAVPTSLSYVAMGHIHAPQPIPGAQVPAEYAGSLLELDFGEAGERKRVVIVEAEPGLPASVRSVPLSGGRRLMRATGRWEELIERPDLVDAFVDLTVETNGPDQGLADRARQHFPFLVKVAASYARAEVDRPARSGLAWDELYRDFVTKRTGAEPSDELLTAFRTVLDEAGRQE
ncbi:MAG: exonuclease SbcCD subunit D [Acidimicrobiia bacterium]|nr:exonuclease SbcCD subunit D [Acidimicrobiia bacterium]